MTEDAVFDRAHANLSPGKRAAALYKEAQTLADANVVAFVALLQDLVDRAAEISDGGDIYATGIRDICKKLGETATFRAQAILSITHHDVHNGVVQQHGSLDEADLAEELSRAQAAEFAHVPAPALAAAAAATSVSFSPFASLEPPAAEPQKIVALHRAPDAAAADAVPADIAEITERLASFGRRAAGFEGG